MIQDSPIVGYLPKEEFSASQISLARGCLAAWGFRKLWGLQAPATRAQAFGEEVHRELQKYAFKQPMAFEHEAAQRALTMVQWLPDVEAAAFMQADGYRAPNEPETLRRSIHLNTRLLVPELEPVRFVGYSDLILGYENLPRWNWYLTDYKTGSTFNYMHTPASLRADVQGNLYSFDVMQNARVDRISGRWIYALSKGARESRFVDWTFIRNDVENFTREIIQEADLLRQIIRLKISPHDLPKNTDFCSSFGGCPYHRSAGGPCAAQIDISKIIFDTGENKNMSDVAELKNRLTQMAAAQQNGQFGLQPQPQPQNAYQPPPPNPIPPLQQAQPQSSQQPPQQYQQPQYPQYPQQGQPQQLPQSYPQQQPQPQQYQQPQYPNPVLSPEAAQAYAPPAPLPMPAPLPQMPPPTGNFTPGVAQSLNTLEALARQAVEAGEQEQSSIGLDAPNGTPKRGRGRPAGSVSKKRSEPAAVTSPSLGYDHTAEKTSYFFERNCEKREFIKAIMLQQLQVNPGANPDQIIAWATSIFEKIEAATR